MNAPLPLSICCRVCTVSTIYRESRAANYECVDCCVRFIGQLIAKMGEYGELGHEERIKEVLSQKLFVSSPTTKEKSMEEQHQEIPHYELMAALFYAGVSAAPHEPVELE